MSLTQRYRDDPHLAPERELPARPGSSEIRDYWDDSNIPPPHRLDNNFNPQSSRDSLHEDPFNPGIGHATGAPPTIPNPMDRNAQQGYGNLNNNDPPYNRYTTSSPWLDQEKTKSRRARRWVIIGIIALALIVAGAVTAGVLVSRNNNRSGQPANSGASSSGSNTSSGPKSPTSTAAPGKPDPNTGYFAVVKQTDPKDPSTFIKDPNLHDTFYGVAYTPFGSILPSCGANLPAVIEDIQLISQITSRIRLYGADCNVTAFVLDAIRQTKVNLQVYVGNYVLPNDDAVYTRQRDIIINAIKTFGTDHIAGITVGNEFMLNWLIDHGGAGLDVNGPEANQGATYLKEKIADTRSAIQALSLSKTIPIGNSDAGAYFNNEVLAGIDYGMANVHPWFANQTAAASAQWTFDFFQNTNIAEANAVPNRPHMYIAETGWPTHSSDAGNANNGASPADVAGLQTFLDTFTCQANTGGTDYFFFSVFDEPWKDAQFGGVEGYWGLFNFNKTLKAGVKLTTCGHN